MNWRDIMIGAIITLMVTIIGGVIVYFVGATIDLGKKTEELVYQIDPPVTFKTELTKIALLSMKATNLGELTAKNVVIGVKFENIAKVLDYKISLSSGPAGKYELISSENGCYKFQLDTLTPGEIINLSFMFEGANDPQLSLSMKSENTVGKKGQVSKGAEVNKTKTDKTIFVSLIILGIFQLLVGFKLKKGLNKGLKKRKINIDLKASVNNTAFLYLHQGLPDKAKSLLEENINRNGGSVFELTNYGLCLAVSGDLEGASLQLKASDFYANMIGSDAAKALVLFNQAILDFITNNVHDGIIKLESALSLDTDVADYIKYSKIVDDLMKNNPDLSKQVLALSTYKSSHNKANSVDAKSRAAD